MAEPREIEIEEGENQGLYLIGAAMVYPALLQSKMLEEITRQIMRPMFASTEKTVREIFKPFVAGDIDQATLVRLSQQKLKTLKAVQVKAFNSRGQKISKEYVKSLSAASKKAAKKSVLDLALSKREKFNDSSRELSAMEALALTGMINLLKTLNSFYLEKVTYEVNSAVRAGDYSDLLDYLKNQRGVTDRWLNNRSGDALRQDYNAMNRAILKENGYDWFVWVYTYRSKEPRTHHKNVLIDTVHSIHEPPVIDPATGERGYPGQLRNCKCVMAPARKI